MPNGFERGNLLVLGVPDRQDDDRCRGPAADPVDDLGAVHVGQAEVEDHRVWPLPGDRREPGRAVGRGADLVVPRGEVDP